MNKMLKITGKHSQIVDSSLAGFVFRLTASLELKNFENNLCRCDCRGETLFSVSADIISCAGSKSASSVLFIHLHLYFSAWLYFSLSNRMVSARSYLPNQAQYFDHTRVVM